MDFIPTWGKLPSAPFSDFRALSIKSACFTLPFDQLLRWNRWVRTEDIKGKSGRERREAVRKGMQWTFPASINVVAKYTLNYDVCHLFNRNVRIEKHASMGSRGCSKKQEVWRWLCWLALCQSCLLEITKLKLQICFGGNVKLHKVFSHHEGEMLLINTSYLFSLQYLAIQYLPTEQLQ